MSTTTRTRPTGWRRWRFLFTPFWLGAIIGSVAFALACWLILAPWQLGRHDERQDRNHTIENALQAPVVGVTEAMRSDGPPTDAVWREVHATGVFLAEDEVAVRLRQDGGGNPASEMVLPFRLTDGTLLLVNRGYLADGIIVGGGWSDPPPAGEVTIQARVRADQPDPSNRAPIVQDGRVQVYGIDSASLLDRVDADSPRLVGFVQLLSGSPGALNPIPVPQLLSGPYQSYGWQWLAFGLIAVLAVGYFAVREGLDPRDEDDREDAPKKTPKVRRGFDKTELYDQ